ncbi:hypothetical protein Tco_1380398 [Tanacetum coccineum]
MVNEEVQLQALVDGKKIIITKVIIRRDLQLEDANGVDCLLNATIFEQLTLMRYEKLSQKLTFYKAFFFPQWKFLIYTILQGLSAKTTAWNEFSSTMASAIICLATNQRSTFPKNVADEAVYEEKDDSLERVTTTATDLDTKQDKGVNIPQSDEDIIKLKELMEILSERVLDLETTKTAQAQDITSLKKRVKKLERKKNSGTHGLKRLYKVGMSARIDSLDDEASLGDQEDASKQGRKIHDIDADEDITLENVHDADMFRVHDLDGDEVFVETEEHVVNAATTTSTTVSAAKDLSDVDMTLTQALAELKSAKPKAVTTTVIITTIAVTRPKAKGLVIQEHEQALTPIVSSLQSSHVKDKEEQEELTNTSIITLFTDLGSTMDDDDIVTYAINGLSEKYGSLAQRIAHKDPFPDLATVRTMVTTEEMRLRSKQPILSTSTTSSSPQVLLATSQPRIQDNRNNRDRDARIDC